MEHPVHACSWEGVHVALQLPWPKVGQELDFDRGDLADAVHQQQIKAI
jgi:hypothetical protein